MSKPILSINPSDVRNFFRTLGKREMLTYLIESGKFDIKEHNDTIKVLRSEHAAILYYNDKKVYVDWWEYNTPTYTMAVYEANFDLILKLQHKPMTYQQLEKTCKKKKILQKITAEERAVFLDKIVQWTFFPSRMVKQFVGKEIPNVPTTSFGF